MFSLVRYLFVKGLLCVRQVVGLGTNRTVTPTSTKLQPDGEDSGSEDHCGVLCSLLQMEPSASKNP